MLVLLRYYPRESSSWPIWEMERDAGRLRHQHRELETHRYKLQQLKKPSERAAQNGDERSAGSPSKWSAERSGATSSA